MALKKLFAQSIIWRGFYFASVLLVNVFLSRYLQAAGTGSLYFLTVIFSFMMVALGLGVDSGIVYFASGNIIEKNKLITLGAAWSFCAGIMMFGFVYLYFLISPASGANNIGWYGLYGFFFVCGQVLTNYCISVYYSRQNYFLPNFLISLVNIVFVFIIPSENAAYNESEARWITLLYFFTFFIAGLLVFASYALQYKREGIIGFPNKTSFVKLVKFSVTALGANVVFFLVYKIDYFFVKYSPVCTPADLGNYIQVSKLGQMMLVVPQIIASVVFPQTAAGEENLKISNAIVVMTRLFTQLFLLAFIVVAVAGQFIFTAVFGESFNKMQIPMLILIPGILSLSVLALVSAYFGGRGRIKINLYAALIALIIMVIGNFIFVPRYGIIAAAAISTLSYAANLVFSLWHFYRDHSLHWKEFISWKKTDYNFIFSLLKRNVA